MVLFLNSQENPDNMLGGDGYTIEIDESSFKKKSKYGRGKMHPDRWVLGIVERDPEHRGRNRKRFFAVPNRNRQTLISLILKHVKPGTTIMTDGWMAYRALGGNNFKHLVCNHKRGFRETGRGNEHVCDVCFNDGDSMITCKISDTYRNRGRRMASR